VGHSRRFGFVRFRRHCGHEFLRQGRDGPSADSCTAATALDLPRSDRDSPPPRHRQGNRGLKSRLVVAFAPVLELIGMRPRRLSVGQESNRRPTILLTIHIVRAIMLAKSTATLPNTMNAIRTSKIRFMAPTPSAVLPRAGVGEATDSINRPSATISQLSSRTYQRPRPRSRIMTRKSGSCTASAASSASNHRLRRSSRSGQTSIAARLRERTPLRRNAR
jgi:hypothetical protein